MKKYKLGLFDSPWAYDNQQSKDPARGGLGYPTLTMSELAALPMYKAFEDNAIIITWVTCPKLIDSYYSKKAKCGGFNGNNDNPLSIIEAWGFRPITVLFTWVKTNKCGQPITEDTDLCGYDDYYSGMGSYTNSNIELAIVAKRGKGLPRVNKNVKQLIFAPIGMHSAKPQAQYARLYDLYGDVPSIEFFARKVNPPPNNWDATGFDWDKRDIREWIKDYDEQ